MSSAQRRHFLQELFGESAVQYACVLTLGISTSSERCSNSSGSFDLDVQDTGRESVIVECAESGRTHPTPVGQS